MSRDRRGRFQPGQSGNPGGRPRRSIPAELGLYATTTAIEGLVVVVRDTRSTPAVRLRACAELLRRVAGRQGRVRGAAELALAWGLLPPGAHQPGLTTPENRRPAPVSADSTRTGFGARVPRRWVREP